MAGGERGSDSRRWVRRAGGPCNRSSTPLAGVYSRRCGPVVTRRQRSAPARRTPPPCIAHGALRRRIRRSAGRSRSFGADRVAMRRHATADGRPDDTPGRRTQRPHLRSVRCGVQCGAVSAVRGGWSSCVCGGVRWKRQIAPARRGHGDARRMWRPMVGPTGSGAACFMPRIQLDSARSRSRHRYPAAQHARSAKRRRIDAAVAPRGRGNRPAGTDRVIARSHGSPRGIAGTHAGAPGWMEDRQQVSLPASRRGCGRRRRPPTWTMQQRETGDIRHSATLARTHARTGRTRGTRQSFRPAWEG